MTPLTAGAGGAAAPATTVDDYAVFCRGLGTLTGIDLMQYKRRQMERRVRAFAERRNAATLPDFLRMLERDEELLGAFLDRLMINVSQLWRNPEQWDTIASELLPELARAGRLRAWSAGCSYGAEAYTLAALCQSTIPTVPVRITGTDIDPRVIERARGGRFDDEDARNAPAAALARWFVREDCAWIANHSLRTLVQFEVGDLLRIVPEPDSYDLILCRNTAIYFADTARDALHRRLADALSPGGFVVLGATERIGAPAEIGLSSVHPFTYRRI
jgi:chemotaxis protein methyltransferase CheR